MYVKYKKENYFYKINISSFLNVLLKYIYKNK